MPNAITMLVRREKRARPPAPALRPRHARPRRWTIHDYRRLEEAGFFSPNERHELIDGVVVSMIPEGGDHSYSIIHATHIFVNRLGDTHYVSCQLPVEASTYSMPKPDFVLYEKSVLDTRRERARVTLAVEVANTSLTYDREDKASLYAAAGIPEYWILNLRKRCLEVHRDPVRMKSGPFRHGYRSVEVLDENAQVSPLCRPDVRIIVAEML